MEIATMTTFKLLGSMTAGGPASGDPMSKPEFYLSLGMITMAYLAFAFFVR